MTINKKAEKHMNALLNLTFALDWVVDEWVTAPQGQDRLIGLVTVMKDQAEAFIAADIDGEEAEA